MSEMMQIKIGNPGQKCNLEDIKKRLQAESFTTQKTNDIDSPQVKILIGPDARAETQRIEPAILLTISGKRLATRSEIRKALNSIGVDIIQMGEKISW